MRFKEIYKSNFVGVGADAGKIAVKGVNDSGYKVIDTSTVTSSTSTNLPTIAAIKIRINNHRGIDQVDVVTSVSISTTANCGLKVTAVL